MTVNFFSARAAMTATECSGKTFSLYCGSESYIIHVLYDQFSYSADDKCITNPDHCSQAEIIQPISAKYCNGYSRCNFLVPSGHTIELCGNQNATSVTVHYNCVPSKSEDFAQSNSITLHIDLFCLNCWVDFVLTRCMEF